MVTLISSRNGNWSDSNPDNACLPGDVVQFGGSATFGNVAYPFTFTAVVQTVDGNNRPSAVFQQNFGGARTVQSVSINVKQLSSGYMSIYRPAPRTDDFDSWKFTVVNNSASPQNFMIMYGVTTVSTNSATAANTSSSYFVFKVGTDGSVPCVVCNGNTIYVEVAKGNAIYDSPDGGQGLLQLSQ